MACRIDADTAVGMLSDIETEPESEDSLYGNLDSDDSVSSREECDDEPENDDDDDSEGDDNTILDLDSSDESSERSQRAPQPLEVEQQSVGGEEAEE